MIECPYCQRKHRDEAGVEKCKAQAEKRAAVAEKKLAELERRRHNAQMIGGVVPLIGKMRREGSRWDQIASAIKKDYPTEWPTDIFSIVHRYAEAEIAPNWGVPTEVARDALLEKYATGEYLTFHPLSGYKQTIDSSTLAPTRDLDELEGIDVDDDD